MGAWNPAKGNRKAGTKPSPKNWRTNKMVIPSPEWLDRGERHLNYYEDMRGAVKANHDVHGRPIISLYQPPYDGFSYGCTPEDVIAMLNLLPEEDVSDIDLRNFYADTDCEICADPWDAYWSRPSREREDAAHRYAAEKAEDLRRRGLIPLEQMYTGATSPGGAPTEP